MGFLVDAGATLDFNESVAFHKHIKEHGVLQFLLLLKKFQDYKKNESELRWGDEIEYHLVNMDPQTKQPRLQLNSKYIYENTHDDVFHVQPEYGEWMLEIVPTEPYKYSSNPKPIIENFKRRYEKIQAICKDGDIITSIPVFPLLGVGDYYVERVKEDEGEQTEDKETNDEEDDFSDIFEQPKNQVTESEFIHDTIINSHPRFPTLTENIRKRRTEKVCIQYPLFKDENTKVEKTTEEPYENKIWMDAMAFGMGNCCLQLTYGVKDMSEARYLTDQLAVFSSLLVPLTAASPIYKGKLSEWDHRWYSICGSVDCRKPEERDEHSEQYIPKSRYGSISFYISDREECKDEYNDLKFPINNTIADYAREEAKKQNVNIDERMINQLGFLFLRDPMSIFADQIYVDDTNTTKHFENLQSTNWNSVRFKPPPSYDSEVGWRVELRTAESGITPEENVAYTMFSLLMVKAILKYNLNFYIPISKVDENFARGHKMDSILKEKFWFRKNIQNKSADEYIELTCDEILNGKEGEFIGLFNVIKKYILEEDGIDLDKELAKQQQDPDYKLPDVAENIKYFDIINDRAKGKKPTIARWMRNFVAKHPKYNKDSIINTEVAGDMMEALFQITFGKKSYEDYQ